MSTVTIGSSQSLQIPALADDGSNWVDYQTKVQVAMGSKGLTRHLEGTAIKPSPYPITGGVAMLPSGNPASDDQIDARETKIEEYSKKEYLAQYIIINSISAWLGTSVKEKPNAHKMWETVKADTSMKTQIHQIDMLKTMHQKRCGENDNVRTHLEELVALWNRLIGMGATVDEPQFHTIILSSLPESY